MSDDTEGPKGLGGWLIVPIFALFVTPLLVAQTLVDTLPVFTDGTWELLTSPASELYTPGFGMLAVFEILGKLVLIGTAIVLLVLIFSKSPRFPKYFVYFLIYNFVFVTADAAWARILVPAAIESGYDLWQLSVRGLLAAVVWIPYMLVSKRVKNTFVGQTDPEPVAGTSPAGGQ